MKPILIYLPGLHGESSLFSGFREAATDHLQVEEILYPKAGQPCVADLAEHVLKELIRREIKSGWVLAESFGSLVIWELVKILVQNSSRGFQVQGIILAGGFIRHPLPRLVASLRIGFALMPDWTYHCWWHLGGQLITLWYWRQRNRVAVVKEFVRHRCHPEDRAALDQRGRWIVTTDLRSTAAQFTGPVFQLSGAWDFVVPWFLVTRQLKKNTSGYQGRRLIWNANHGVLFEKPRPCVEQIVRWLQQIIPDPS